MKEETKGEKEEERRRKVGYHVVLLLVRLSSGKYLLGKGFLCLYEHAYNNEDIWNLCNVKTKETKRRRRQTRQK